MRIGIHVSQTTYSNTGVANYLSNLVTRMIELDKENEYVLFFSSMRRKIQNSIPLFANSGTKLKIKSFRFPPLFLDILWNRLHILPIETLIGDIDVFISSDWIEPPTKRAKKITILYDLIALKYPNETDKKIVQTQKCKLNWVKKESDMVICISESTKNDAKELLGIEESRLKVVYPGV